jgi:hypothetical protein
MGFSHYGTRRYGISVADFIVAGIFLGLFVAAVLPPLASSYTINSPLLPLAAPSPPAPLPASLFPASVVPAGVVPPNGLTPIDPVHLCVDLVFGALG